MSPLIFTLKPNLAFKLDCRRLTPNTLADLTLTQIKNSSLVNTKNSHKVSDFFEVSGENSQNIIFKNTNNQLDYIGHKMTNGQIIIEGDCGDFLGANMQGGTIICQGNAGARLGDQMRRGLILIDGNVGDYCGSRMIAGTIGVLGSIGKFTGYAMKRGTIILKKPTILNKPIGVLTNHNNFHATIQDCGTHTLPFLALLFQSFQTLPSKFSGLNNQRVQRFAGDLACDGNGEILVLV